jgi:hypothetical protein
MASRAPDKVLRAGSVEAAIWMEESVQEDGRAITRHSIRIQKRYRDESGNWKTTEYFQPAQIADLELVSRSAFAYCRLKDSENTPDSN